ncbi:MAG: conserved hypothetical protein [Methanobrevibacter sp. CfCl-M3]
MSRRNEIIFVCVGLLIISSITIILTFEVNMKKQCIGETRTVTNGNRTLDVTILNETTSKIEGTLNDTYGSIEFDFKNKIFYNYYVNGVNRTYYLQATATGSSVKTNIIEFYTNVTRSAFPELNIK